LADLYEEEKIQFVNPSQDMKIAYLKKSESYLLSAKLLRDHDQFEQSVSMAYYSMYYSVLALFFRTGIKCENHAAAIVLLRSVFNIWKQQNESGSTSSTMWTRQPHGRMSMISSG
jgi:uncharacterized protein (UPF0332 family)